LHTGMVLGIGALGSALGILATVARIGAWQSERAHATVTIAHEAQA